MADNSFVMPPPSHPDFGSILELMAGIASKRNEDNARVNVFKKIDTSSPFSLEILAEEVPERLKQP